MYLVYRDIDILIKKNGDIVNFDVNSYVYKTKTQFNKAISDLSVKHNCIEYWLTRISERNTLQSDLFLDVCRINFIESFINQDKETLVFTNNVSIYRYFKQHKIIKISSVSRFMFTCKAILSDFKPYLSLIKFLVERVSFRIRYARKKYRKDLSGKVVIQTWASDNNFKLNKFIDTYHGDLASHLRNLGKDVETWPLFYNVKDQRGAIAILRNKNHIVMEDYLNFSDYFQAIKHFYVKRYMKLGRIYIDSSDFTSVFRHYQRKEVVEYSSLIYQFTKRIKEYSGESINFIQNFENLIPEKALIMGVKKYLKKSKVVGIFHTTKPNNLLCLEYADYKEFVIAPRPDKVVFNSNTFKVLFEKKFPALPSCNGVPLKRTPIRDNGHYEYNSKGVLVLFSGVVEEVDLLLSMLNNIDTDEYYFLFRMHPMNNFNIKDKYSSNNYEVVNNMPLDEVILKVSKVISSYSAAALESAIRGRYVGLIYNPNRLLLNPFDNTKMNNYKLISLDEELRAFLSCDSFKISPKIFFNDDLSDYSVFLEKGIAIKK
jgi:hypothetical protein